VLAGDLELSDEATDALKSSSVIAQYEI
jgi:hypothetical protein